MDIDVGGVSGSGGRTVVEPEGATKRVKTGAGAFVAVTSLMCSQGREGGRLEKYEWLT